MILKCSESPVAILWISLSRDGVKSKSGESRALDWLLLVTTITVLELPE